MNSSPSSGNTSPFSVLQDKSPLALAQASSNVSLPNNCVCVFRNEFTGFVLYCILTQLYSSCCKVPNGEATDVEMPGKSSSEDEARGGPFTAGENLMGR